MRDYAGKVYLFVIACSLLAFSGNIFMNPPVVNSASENPDPITQGWLDFTGLVTDVSTFVIIGFVGYMATKVNSWIKGNKEWKASIQVNFDQANTRMTNIENDTRNTNQKLNTAVELLIEDFKTHKQL